MPKTQDLKGFPIPEIIEPEGTRCIAIQIPDHDDYHRAVIAQVTMLGKWWKWKKTNSIDQHAALVAQVVRDNLLYTPVGESVPCEILDPEGGFIVTTFEELKDAVCAGVKCAAADIGATLAAGINSNIELELDENGDPIVAGSGGDGGEFSGTTEQQLSGAVREVRLGLDQFLSDFEAYYQTYGIALITPQTFLKSKYLTDEALLDQAYSDYVDYREALSPTLSPFGDDLDAFLFCDGVTKQVVNTYIIDELATDDLLQIQIVDSLLTDQFGVWYDAGLEKPQDEYLPFPCVRREIWEVEYTAAQFIADTPVYLDAPTGFAHYPTDRRVRITLSGKFIDSLDSGNTSDPFYRTATGVAGQTPQTYDRFRLDNGSGALTFIVYPDTIPAYSPTGNYSWIVIVSAGNYNDFYINENIAANDSWRANATGSITITVEDLGEA